MGRKWNLDQTSAPLFEAIRRHIESGVVPFHVPGHKGGRGIIEEFKEYVGEQVFRMDLNGMDDLDNICNPLGAIKESEDLMAELFGAGDSFFLVNGTSQGVQAMILYACRPGEKIIVPRNVHKSVIGGLILSGAIPIYIQPEFHARLGIALGVEPQSLRACINRHPDARAVFINNPTYYGVASDIKAIIGIAHENDMLVLADEAHGAHLPFHPDLPPSAISQGGDLSAISLHKTGGSMTQSSVLLSNNKNINPAAMKTVINLMQTTSASYILMASLDLARKHLALRGDHMMERAVSLAKYARQGVNKIDGLYAFGTELVGHPGIFGFDETKLCINVRELGMSGYEMESFMRKQNKIQMEMSDFHNTLAVISLGDDRESVDRLIDGLGDIARNRKGGGFDAPMVIPPALEMVVSPREAFYLQKKTVPLESSAGEVSGEMVMAYPPGIPALSLGELITKDIIEYIKMMKKSKYQLQGGEDPFINNINVLSRERV
ncbi:MAG TPA: aminotransferase class I/II-fold pyridoxal phosphate-dependent enzyme [Clostridia bacterium]|nr:aminotransferase class I/II-fold pyridoxal phosphate-dependent enzyme [Clostridia bacterium]